MGRRNHKTHSSSTISVLFIARFVIAVCNEWKGAGTRGQGDEGLSGWPLAGRIWVLLHSTGACLYKYKGQGTPKLAEAEEKKKKQRRKKKKRRIDTYLVLPTFFEIFLRFSGLFLGSSCRETAKKRDKNKSMGKYERKKKNLSTFSAKSF
jgi:hypothetical protein